jgi:hypothetical protein
VLDRVDAEAGLADPVAVAPDQGGLISSEPSASSSVEVLQADDVAVPVLGEGVPVPDLPAAVVEIRLA